MNKIVMAVIAAAVAGIAVPGAVQAAPACKDAKGKFIKCPPAVVAKPMVKPAPMAKPMVMSSGLTKDKNGRCHYAAGPKKGQFAKCG